jgi:acyl carrier protein
MDKQEILGSLTEILRDILDREDFTLSLTTRAPDIAGWDSFENIRFIVAVEQRFDVRFATGDVLELKNVGEFVDLIARTTSG